MTGFSLSGNELFYVNPSALFVLFYGRLALAVGKNFTLALTGSLAITRRSASACRMRPRVVAATEGPLPHYPAAEILLKTFYPLVKTIRYDVGIPKLPLSVAVAQRELYRKCRCIPDWRSAPGAEKKTRSLSGKHSIAMTFTAVVFRKAVFSFSAAGFQLINPLSLARKAQKPLWGVPASPW